MTLQNLFKIGRLKEHQPTPAEVQRLLAAAERNLADARVAEISDETLFDAAHRAVMQCELEAMLATGFRPSTSEPGHHQTLIQSLPLTLGVTNDVWVVRDALRRKRNASDYTGHAVQPAMVSEASSQAAKVSEQIASHFEN